MRFRPCIDLHKGRVVQIVGESLGNDAEGPILNFETGRAAADFAAMYKRDDLPGGHVISLGPGNREEALSALRAFPGGLQVGGGITPENAADYLDAGASHVIVTSYVFTGGRIDGQRLRELVGAAGKSRLVLDLSCRRKGDEFRIVTDRWQTFTDVSMGPAILERLAEHCDEFLVHGVDVEGKILGIQEGLVTLLGAHSPITATYAGGVTSISDLERVKQLGGGRVDVTVGSALDIFGGDIPYRRVVEWDHANRNNAVVEESANRE